MHFWNRCRRPVIGLARGRRGSVQGFAGGVAVIRGSCYCNLCALCRHHHLLKDGIGGFTLTRSADGTYTWTTILGHTVTRAPTDTLGAGDHALNGQPTLRQTSRAVDDPSTDTIAPNGTRPTDHPMSVAATSVETDQPGDNSGITMPSTDRMYERERRDLEQMVWDRDLARYRIPADDSLVGTAGTPDTVNEATDGSPVARPTAQRSAADLPNDPAF